MARFNSTITNYGSRILTELIAAGAGLTLTRAAAGDGKPAVSPDTLTALVSPRADIQTNIGEKTVVDGDPVVIRIPVQVTNQGLAEKRYVREIGIFATHEGKEFLFAYSWVVGPDVDNVLDVSGLPGEADSIHIQDVGLFVTNQEAASLSVQIGGGTYITNNELYTYAATVDHTHTAAEIKETTGESVEIVQRRQDVDIAALKEQLDTGFTGTSVTHTMAAAELEEWTGYDGTGYPEGIYDEANALIYA